MNSIYATFYAQVWSKKVCHHDYECSIKESLKVNVYAKSA